jgi:type I restriction enzyme R subunit
MKPEEKARIKIDQMFIDAGWAVVDRDHYAPNITAVAIKEGLLKGNLEADYFLFINGKAVGILEAKREEVDVSNNTVCEQAALYVRSVPNCYQAYMKPLPLIYQSNGNVVQFKDYRNADSDYLELNRIHTPKEIVRILCRTSRLA